jgi:glycogen debranching enzyme
VSARGEEFEVAGRAGPVALVAGPPIPAEARAELLVIKAGSAFLCAREDGDVRVGAPSGEGFYAEDTRFLSELRLSFGAVAPVLLSHALESGSRAVVHATNPELADAAGATVPQDTLALRRTIEFGDRLYCAVTVRNYCPHSVVVPLALVLAADYADVFEVRGVQRRRARGQVMVPNLRGSTVTFGYEGQDRTFRQTRVELQPPPAALELDGQRVQAAWQLPLTAGEERELLIAITPSTSAHHTAPRPRGTATRGLDAGQDEWVGECARIQTNNELFEQVLRASMRDLQALLTPTEHGRIAAAGIPWFVAPFGRDSLITALEGLVVNPSRARDTLHVLAALQAHAEEPWRDAEPGKILHELRVGELARAGLIPHTPYYGTVDATPLFVMLAGAYHRWTGDLETLRALGPALDRALGWIDRYGDRDGDGFIEYECRSPAGLLNQGWKDSEDAIVHADGTLAEGPIALVEAQGYVYAAKQQIAEVYDALGQHDRASALRGEAQRLREAFNEVFWNAQEGTFALALDGRKRQVASVTSNPGHCLAAGIVEVDKARALAERLMAPDMFSGWGIRTLSAESAAYNPMSYHNGSIWPHDNAIIADGLKRYGFTDAAQQVTSAIFEIAARARDNRLAELYCGFDRAHTPEIVPYPVACSPQAWAAAAPFLLLQTLLGITPDAPGKTLNIIQPQLPTWLRRIELQDLRLGAATVSLAFTQHAGITGFSLLEQHGEVAVTMAAAPL